MKRVNGQARGRHLIGQHLFNRRRTPQIFRQNAADALIERFGPLVGIGKDNLIGPATNHDIFGSQVGSDIDRLKTHHALCRSFRPEVCGFNLRKDIDVCITRDGFDHRAPTNPKQKKKHKLAGSKRGGVHGFRKVCAPQGAVVKSRGNGYPGIELA